MQDDTNSSRYPAGTILVHACVIGLALLVGPLLVALCEHLCFGTRHFEHWLERLGVHDFLGDIYEKMGISTTIRRLIP